MGALSLMHKVKALLMRRAVSSCFLTEDNFLQMLHKSVVATNMANKNQFELDEKSLVNEFNSSN